MHVITYAWNDACVFVCVRVCAFVDWFDFFLGGVCSVFDRSSISCLYSLTA